MGIKVKKIDYSFLDHFMLIQKEAEYNDIKLDLLRESEEVVLEFITYRKASVYMKMAAHEAREIEFKSNVIRIPTAQAETIGKKILAGEFINNYLKLQLTIKPVSNDFSQIEMDGIFWVDCNKKTAPSECSFYLLCFIEEINQIHHEILDGTCKVRLIDYGYDKVSVMKLVRQITGLRLKEAKELVETAPNAIIDVRNRQAAESLCKELFSIGAQAKIT
jgi:hypothetical protein